VSVCSQEAKRCDDCFHFEQSRSMNGQWNQVVL
jgi:hypothetical protein